MTVSKKQWIFPLVALLTLALSLAACGDDDDSSSGDQASQSPADGTPDDTGDDGEDGDSRLVIASITTPPTIDSEFYSGAPQAWEIGANLYDSYFGYEGMDINNRGERSLSFDTIEGRLVESADESADGLTWTLHLRQGVIGCSGNEMTSADVKYAYDRAFGLNATGFFLSATVNLSAADNVTVVDDYTVEIKLDALSPIFQQVYTLYYPAIVDSAIVQEHATDEDPWATEWLGTNSAGYGPYCVTDFTAGQQVVMEANPNYWEGEVPIKEVVYRAVPDSAQRLSLLQSGDVDVALALSPRQLAEVEGNSDLKVGQQKPGNTYISVALNATTEPFDDPLVRQALSYAVPYDEIVNDVYRGFAVAGDSYTPPNFPDYTNEFWPYEQDLDQARDLLEQAGLADGFDFTLTFAEFTPAERDVALAMQTAFSDIGVNMEINIVSPAVHQDAFVNRTEPAIMYTAQSHIYDTVYGMQIFLGSGAASYLNAGNYVSAELDAIFEEGAGIPQNERRSEIAKEAQEILAGDAPWLIPAIEDYAVAMRADVEGFAFMPDNGLRFYFLSR